MAYRFNIFDNGAALAETLAERVAGTLAEAVAMRGHASIAVSGGSTPKAFFRALSSTTLDWSRVTITLVDERFVPESNERSNHALVSAGLLQGKAAEARFVPLYHDGATAEDAARLATAATVDLCRPFDVVVLGMGGDGHTASFFPGGSNLQMALDPATPRGVITMEAEGAGEPRLTFTFSALQDARLLILHIESQSKKPVIDRALSEGKDSTLPIGRVIATASSDTEIYWAP
ncbi:6-phosphogluconolactonase [Rhizobium sp. KVB221]|uniref:6-phosphogluconolactonase n=1 Tax=Rhizobium setariae TaxID=2801340 RepID=A0A936YJG3_9HYPH|nr:6-phosphogluconolactonase [Rhizobium setariae]MBL0370713.1 6-phosphogluconolactonase [Rhizobium setariae]